MLNIKTDSVLKKKAQDLAQELGLSLSVILNNYLKEFVKTERVVFEKPLIPNAKTRKSLNQTLKDIKEGKNMEGPFETAEDMIRALNS